MATRYDSSKQVISKNDNGGLKDIIDRRNVTSITHFDTAKLKYPSVEQIKNFNIVKYVWKHNDRYWKLANEYYGDSKYWWVIAWYNRKPIEATLVIGQQISIPLPLSDVLEAIT